MSHEVELKFDLAPGDVERLLASPALAAGPKRIVHYETRYFDTGDDVLRGAGFSLRIRRADGRYTQTVKRKRASKAGLFVRQEWDRPVAGFSLDRGALKSTPLKRLLGAVKPKALASRVRTRFRRSSWLVERRGSRIEVVLDEGVVISGKAEAPICEIELELIEGKPRALFELAGEIGAAVPLRLGVFSKQERGLALAEGRLGQTAKAEPIALAAPLTEADAFRAVAHSCLHHYRLNEIVLLGGADANALHQARIALRRLRSALSLFRPTVRGKDLNALRDELGWLAGQFGDARNLDVLLAGDPGLDGDSSLLEARGRAYERVAAALRAERALRLLLRLAWWVESGAWRYRERASGDASALASSQLERQWRKVRRDASHMGKADSEERHKLRLAVKRLRYSAEFFAGLYGKRSKTAGRDRFIAALKDLQDRLGDLADSEAAEAVTSAASFPCPGRSRHGGGRGRPAPSDGNGRLLGLSPADPDRVLAVNLAVPGERPRRGAEIGPLAKGVACEDRGVAAAADQPPNDGVDRDPLEQADRAGEAGLAAGRAAVRPPDDRAGIEAQPGREVRAGLGRVAALPAQAPDPPLSEDGAKHCCDQGRLAMQSAQQRDRADRIVRLDRGDHDPAPQARLDRLLRALRAVDPERLAGPGEQDEARRRRQGRVQHPADSLAHPGKVGVRQGSAVDQALHRHGPIGRR